MWKPGLRRIWRGPHTLQLGVDVPRPVVLHPVDDALETWLRALDGRLRLPEVVDGAVEAGLSEADAVSLLGRLLDAGLLADAATPDPVLAALPRQVRDRLAPDLAAAALADPRPDAAVVTLRARRALRVVVVSDDRLGVILAEHLVEAGVGAVDACDAADLPIGPGRGRPLLVVPSAVARVSRHALAEASTPHLVTEVGETVVRLGPLVLPGRSACFGCLEQGRLDRDPGWAPVSAQLVGRPPGAGATTLLRVAGGLAALHLLAWCAGDDPPVLDGVVEVHLPHGRTVRRGCPPHPVCGCTWPSAAPHVTMTE
jgi:hypothetical protein